MSRKSELIKGIEYPLEGAAIVVAGPELVERAIEKYGANYMVNVADLPLAEKFVSGAQAVAVPLAALLVAWAGLKYMGKGLKEGKNKN